MSTLMEDEGKRWTAKRKAALAMEIIQGKSRVAEASRSTDPISRALISADGAQLRGLHEPCHAVLTSANSSFFEVVTNPWAAINARTLIIEVTDLF
jgi:hypothetical protein